MTIFLHLSGCIEQIGMNKKFSQVFSVGPKAPKTNGILPQFL